MAPIDQPPITAAGWTMLCAGATVFIGALAWHSPVSHSEPRECGASISALIISSDCKPFKAQRNEPTESRVLDLWKVWGHLKTGLPAARVRKTKSSERIDDL